MAIFKNEQGLRRAELEFEAAKKALTKLKRHLAYKFPYWDLQGMRAHLARKYPNDAAKLVAQEKILAQAGRHRDNARRADGIRTQDPWAMTSIECVISLWVEFFALCLSLARPRRST